MCRSTLSIVTPAAGAAKFKAMRGAGPDGPVPEVVDRRREAAVHDGAGADCAHQGLACARPGPQTTWRVISGTSDLWDARPDEPEDGLDNASPTGTRRIRSWAASKPAAVMAWLPSLRHACGAISTWRSASRSWKDTSDS